MTIITLYSSKHDPTTGNEIGAQLNLDKTRTVKIQACLVDA